MDIKLPGKAECNDADADDLLWDIIIPYSQNEITYKATVTCSNEYWASGDSYFGMSAS